MKCRWPLAPSWNTLPLKFCDTTLSWFPLLLCLLLFFGLFFYLTSNRVPSSSWFLYKSNCPSSWGFLHLYLFLKSFLGPLILCIGGSSRGLIRVPSHHLLLLLALNFLYHLQTPAIPSPPGSQRLFHSLNWIKYFYCFFSLSSFALWIKSMFHFLLLVHKALQAWPGPCFPLHSIPLIH